MDDIFRSIFGLPRRDGLGSRYPDRRECLPFEADQEDDGDSQSRSPYQDGGNVFLFTNPGDIVRQFDEMFANFERVFQGFGSIGSIEIPPAEHYSSDEDVARNSMPTVPGFEAAPRDNMLKHPDSLESDQFFPHNRRHHERRHNWFDSFWRKSPVQDDKLDTDVDESVLRGGLDSLFRKRDEEKLDSLPQHEVVPRRETLFHGVTVQTHRSADGRITETRKMMDGDGNEQTVVTRTMDGKTVRQTTKKNRKGETEVIEDLINMDEDEKIKFDKKWNYPSSYPSPQQPTNDVLRSFQEDRHEDKSIFARLFGTDFRGF